MYNLTQRRKRLTWWRKLPQAHAPVCSQRRAYWGHWKINDILQTQIPQIHSISGKASCINPSGFSLIPGALNYWRVINLKSAVPASFLPRTWAGHSETFPASMLRTEGRRGPHSWSKEEGEELTVFTPRHLHTTASSTRRVWWVVTAPPCVKKQKKNLLMRPLQSVFRQLLTSTLEVLWMHMPWFFFLSTIAKLKALWDFSPSCSTYCSVTLAKWIHFPQLQVLPYLRKKKKKR